MKKKINSTHEPISFKVIDDFLPPPKKLVLKLKKETVNNHDKSCLKEAKERYKAYSNGQIKTISADDAFLKAYSSLK